MSDEILNDAFDSLSMTAMRIADERNELLKMLKSIAFPGWPQLDIFEQRDRLNAGLALIGKIDGRT